MPRDALATYIAKEVFPERTGTDFIEFREQLLLQLYHVHLPMLAEGKVIEMENHQIEPGTMFAAAVAFLEETC